MTKKIVFGQGDEQPEKQLGFFDYVNLTNVKIRNPEKAMKLAVSIDDYKGIISQIPEHPTYTSLTKAKLDQVINDIIGSHNKDKNK